MKSFLDREFLLDTPTASHLYHTYAENMPIVDYHCHISPEEIANDRHFHDITEVWLGGDHYKWRYLRSCGVDEFYITGEASHKEKFLKWAEVLGKAVGNPLYHWSHLELQRYFGFQKPLNQHTASEAWEFCNAKLSEPSMSARNLILTSNVKLICTTDDPIDSLKYHKIIANDSSFPVQVLPAWRPDRAMSPEKDDYLEYLTKLSDASGVNIHTFQDLKLAIRTRMDHFTDNGCTISDHGLSYVMYVPSSEDETEEIFAKRQNGNHLTQTEILKFKTAFLMFACKEYTARHWVLQLHYGCKRNNNTKMYQRIGADTGYDCISNYTPSDELADFLNALCENNSLPKTILYSLNPADNQCIDTIIGCFQDSDTVSKIQHGSAWWFNDNKHGMLEHLSSLASLGNLSGFIGMLTDSRSFLSYTRHEYFRRILCNYIGTLVENGEFDNDEQILQELIQDISYNNAVRYFAFHL